MTCAALRCAGWARSWTAVWSALVREVIIRAGSTRAVVSTGKDNLPARTLYEGLGFSPVGDREAIPGLWVTDYLHRARLLDLRT